MGRKSRRVPARLNKDIVINFTAIAVCTGFEAGRLLRCFLDNYITLLDSVVPLRHMDLPVNRKRQKSGCTKRQKRTLAVAMIPDFPPVTGSENSVVLSS